ncbi:hypothetical protein I8748_32285 [Nostoc sp. CENA67]|uniref:Uncharacterized protein n=1 Tax=Amazonocrinis nigriterrae CENA67 TaxID=2794033 RepID=A0A8J7I0D0_9NOST|nr:hypothetical protein [Amazonocrinis nigriterrae]MBH8566777.1 hypothetical protein [Amazonocrinis nigriterrae CENA67]
MLKHYYPLPWPDKNSCDSELQSLAEKFIRPDKALQELPLILIPEYLLSLSFDMKQQHPFIQKSTQKWLDDAKKDDERLRIERRWIPHTPVYIPNTNKGKQFFKIAKAIGDIPLNTPVIPKNQNQGYWLKTLHYYWQAIGVTFAHQLLGLIQDPLEEGILNNRLPQSIIQSLKLTRNIDMTLFQILVRGQRIIKTWARQNKISYPFNQPLEIFLEILKQDFLIRWQIDPCNQDWEWMTKKIQRDNILTRIYLLKEAIWKESSLDNAGYCKSKEEYLDYLKQANTWNNNWVFAMQAQIEKNAKYNNHLEPYLEAYITAVQEGKELFVDEFDWRSGNPYKKQVNGQQITNRPLTIQGDVDPLGYIQWYYS